jgi:hypothetical protein
MSGVSAEREPLKQRWRSGDDKHASVKLSLDPNAAWPG